MAGVARFAEQKRVAEPLPPEKASARTSPRTSAAPGLGPAASTGRAPSFTGKPLPFADPSGLEAGSTLSLSFTRGRSEEHPWRFQMPMQQVEQTPRFATAEDWFEEDEFEELSEPFVTDDDCFEQGAAFDGFRIQVRSRQFRSGRVTAVLSGVTVDLREARPSPEGATLDIQSALSGVTILVPKDWEVSCDVEAVCGGISEDRFAAEPQTSRPRLRVTGTVVAGGLSVR